MKIKEAVNRINKMDSFVAKHKNNCLFIFSIGEEDHFIEFKDDQTSFLSSADFSGMSIAYNAEPKELLEVLEIIRELVETPIEERILEKKYRLRWIDDGDGGGNYLSKDAMDQWDLIYACGGDYFTESELEQLKKANPRLAPAIDAMKEEVPDDAC